MRHTVNETQRYVISLACDVQNGDVSAATLAVLMELGFQSCTDGFGYLRKSICMKCLYPDMKIAAIYHEIVRVSGPGVSYNQVEQAIFTSIENAWTNRDREQWDYFFSESVMGSSKKPTNKQFICQIAVFMELWCSHCKEVVYGTK